MACDCPVCKGRGTDKEGLLFAEKEVIPFVKELLNPNYPNHPLPRKYEGLLASLLCYSQAASYDRIHNEPPKKYYTSNKWLLKISAKLNEKFPNTSICDIRNMEGDVREVCEFNVGVENG